MPPPCPDQAKSFYQGVKIRVLDTIKRKQEILPALEKWMVDNGHMGIGMDALVPTHKAEPPNTPAKGDVKSEELDDGLGDLQSPSTKSSRPPASLPWRPLCK